MIGMAAICNACGAKVSSGIKTHEQLLEQYPKGCHYCSRAADPNTRSDLAAMIKENGYAFVDMEGIPIKPKGKK